jgi:hypothetical protein
VQRADRRHDQTDEQQDDGRGEQDGDGERRAIRPLARPAARNTRRRMARKVATVPKLLKNFSAVSAPIDAAMECMRNPVDSTRPGGVDVARRLFDRSALRDPGRHRPPP